MSPYAVVARREMRETLTDWRLLIPMLTLAFLFPGILALGMKFGLPYLGQIDPSGATEKAGLFGAAMAAFFPISFSLIIALESFAGERERNTLEALLASPVSDVQMFLGKVIAVLVPPAFLSLTGLAVFAVGARLLSGLELSLDTLVLAVALGMAEALAMVAAAVVVSSQAPTVKAANILASFIIIPVAVAVQAEVMLLFTGYGQVLWFIFAGFLLVALLLLRMGVQLFNREEILTRENQVFSWAAIARCARRLWREVPGDSGSELRGPVTIKRLYLVDFPHLLHFYRGPLLVVLLGFVAGGLIGYFVALANPLEITGAAGPQGVSASNIRNIGHLVSAPGIFGHNVRTVALAAVLSLFTFGVAGMLVVMFSTAAVGFLAGQAAMAGIGLPQFLLAFVMPHGMFEIPALGLAGALNLWLGMCLMTLPKHRSLGEGLMLAAVNWVKGALVFVPLLLVAAVVEAKLTPMVAALLYGG